MINNPVYIAGLERSGTSLIYALLGSHPSIAMTRRTNLWTHFYGQYGDLGQPKRIIHVRPSAPPTPATTPDERPEPQRASTDLSSDARSQA